MPIILLAQVWPHFGVKEAKIFSNERKLKKVRKLKECTSGDRWERVYHKTIYNMIPILLLQNMHMYISLSKLPPNIVSALPECAWHLSTFLCAPNTLPPSFIQMAIYWLSLPFLSPSVPCRALQVIILKWKRFCHFPSGNPSHCTWDEFLAGQVVSTLVTSLFLQLVFCPIQLYCLFPDLHWPPSL